MALIKSALIVTHGRTGSTLLQGILNAIDGWHIKGENYNFSYGLYLSIQALTNLSEKNIKDPYSPTDPWFGVKDYNIEENLNAVQSIIKNNLLAGQNVEEISTCGFKEIGYFDLFWDDPTGETLSKYLDFLIETLKHCKLSF